MSKYLQQGEMATLVRINGKPLLLLAKYKPVLNAPEGVDIWNLNDKQAIELRGRAEELVKNVLNSDIKGLMLPFGWNLTLLEYIDYVELNEEDEVEILTASRK